MYFEFESEYQPSCEGNSLTLAAIIPSVKPSKSKNDQGGPNWPMGLGMGCTGQLLLNKFLIQGAVLLKKVVAEMRK